MSKLTIRIGSTISGLKAGLSNGMSRVKKFVSGVRSSFGGLAGTFGALISVAGIKRGIDALDDLGKTAGKIGVSTDAVQKYNYAAKITGTTSQTVATSFKRMASVILDAENGLTESKRALSDLNLSWEKLAGLKPERQFELIVAALNKVDDASRRNALAQDMFGRGGQELQIFIRDFKELSNEIESMGAIIPESTIRNAEKLNDTIAKIKTNWAANIMKGYEFFGDIANGDPLGKSRSTAAKNKIIFDKQKQVRGMGKEAAGMGKADLARQFFQTADEIGTASGGSEMKRITEKYKKLKAQLIYEKKNKTAWEARLKEATATDEKKEKEVQKAETLKGNQNQKIQDYISSMEKEYQLQKLINAGKQKEAAIEKALSDAKRSGGRDLSQKEKADISKATADLYDITKAGKKDKSTKTLAYENTNTTDSLRRIGGNIGGVASPELEASRQQVGLLKEAKQYLASIDEKTELTFNGDNEMRFPGRVPY
jgi:hypothetical protein